MELTKELIERMSVAKTKFRQIESPTWRDLYKVVEEVKFEYGYGYMSGPSLNTTYWLDKKIDGTVVAYWVKGGSEATWVHVHEMQRESCEEYKLTTIIILLKFGTENEEEDSEMATNFILECCRDLNMW
jgi:hypothetical protein